MRRWGLALGKGVQGIGHQVQQGLGQQHRVGAQRGGLKLGLVPAQIHPAFTQAVAAQQAQRGADPAQLGIFDR